MQNSLEVIIKRINAQAANIFLIEEKKQVFQCIQSKHQAYLEDYEIPLTQGVMGKAVLQKKCIRVGDVRKAGLHEIPVVVTQADDLKSLEFAIVENVQRHDLNPLEEAQGYKRLINEFSYDQEKVSKFIGKSRSYITNSLRLLTLPEDVLKLIESKKLSSGHAKILVGLENPSFVANKIIEKKLSVRQSEKFVKIFKTKKRSYFTSRDPNIHNLETSIIDKIGLNVKIKNSKHNKGHIIFEYKSLDQLNKIIEIIKANY